MFLNPEELSYRAERIAERKINSLSFVDFRKLCIEALIEEGDGNQDWRLSQKEFSKLMDKNYTPSYKCKSFAFPPAQQTFASF